MLSIMKQISVAAVLLLSLFITSFSQNNDANENDRSKQQVRDAVARFSKAFLEADRAALDSLLAEDYIHTNSTGSVLNKQQWLAYLKTRRADLDSGRLEIESYENKDLRIRVYGEAAIVTGLNVAKGKREGKPFVAELRFTHLWIKESGKWKRAAFHDSALTR